MAHPENSTVQPNSTTLLTSEETNAAWFIFIVVGFFGFLIFALMVTNLLNREIEDEPYIEYLEKQSKKREASVKLKKNNVFHYANNPALLKSEDGRKCKEEPRNNTDQGQKQPENSANVAGATASVETIFYLTVPSSVT
ncbi:hypothetical protein FKM82_008107 [Ascaphus truei]